MLGARLREAFLRKLCYVMHSEMTAAAREQVGRSVLEVTPELDLEEYKLEVCPAQGKAQACKRKCNG